MPGTIKIDSIPTNLDVYIDGEYVGKTPIDIIDVDDGIHLLNIRYDIKENEEKELSKEIIVYSNKITQLEIDISKNSINENSIDSLSLQSNECLNPTINMTIPNNGICSDPSIDISIQEEQKTQLPIQQPSKSQDQEISTIPPENVPEQVSPVSLNDILNEIKTTNDTLLEIITSIKESTRPLRRSIYDNESVISSAVTADPKDPVSSLYQQEKVWATLGENAPLIHVYNYGPGLLYVVSSINGVDFTKETVILEGELKDYTDIYVLGLRSPTVMLRYRVTERSLLNQASQRFSGSRFKDRRDRSGVIVYHDDYESPTLKFETSIVGAGTIARSTDTAYAGDFSIKFITGGVHGNSNTMIYRHSDVHSAKMAAQIRFSVPNTTAFAEPALAVEHDDGTVAHKGDVFFQVGGAPNGTLFVRTQTGTIKVATKVPVDRSLVLWNSLKLIIDISTSKYVAVIINGIKIDLSSFDLIVTPSALPEQVQVFISLAEENGGLTTYFDDYIFTEDET